MKHLGWGLASFVTGLFRTTTTMQDSTTSSTTTTTLASSSTTTPAQSMTANHTPPVAHRDETRVVYAGNHRSTEGTRQSASSTETLLDPPVAVPDPYGWLRDDARTAAAVRRYLDAENAYTTAGQARLEPLRDGLYTELVAALQETDTTVPRPYLSYSYYSRTFTGQAYPVYCRAPRASSSAAAWDECADTPVLPHEQILLNVNVLADGHAYCAVAAVEDSPSQQLLAYTVDVTGDEIHQLFVKDIATGEILDHDEDLEMEGSIQWGADDTTLFYVKMDDAMRPYQVYRRRVGGESAEEDELLFQEDDDTFEVSMGKSEDKRYLFISSESMETSEVHYLDLQQPPAAAVVQCVAPRRRRVLYEVAHRAGVWWIQSNFGGLPNLALWACAAQPHCQDAWKLVRDADGNVLFDGGYQTSLDDVSMFANHVVFSGRTGGLPRIWFASLFANDKSSSTTTTVTSMTRLEFPERAFDVCPGSNYEYHAERVAIAYDSLVTPTQTWDISLHDPTDRVLLRQRPVPGYDKSLYGCDRVVVRARDGQTEIPVSLVYRKDTMATHESTGKPVPLLLYGTLFLLSCYERIQRWSQRRNCISLLSLLSSAYGAYGSCEEATFSSTTLTLLNRGVVYAIAHVRGGGEMGRQWYEEPNGAKYLCKKNSFNDFVDVARWLVEERKLTSAELLACNGASAGGLLAAAAINQAPELFKAAIIEVPFVDVMATMVDASLPLTANEWEEWGMSHRVNGHFRPTFRGFSRQLLFKRQSERGKVLSIHA